MSADRLAPLSRAAEPCRIMTAAQVEGDMPYRRGGFALTPPSIWIFAISLILAVIAVLVHYARIKVPIINPTRVFDVLVIAYILLVIGVLFRRL
jgi:hypothetical protein